jgi:hypothetical protein
MIWSALIFVPRDASKAASVSGLFHISEACDVAYWHETDLTRCLLFGRYRGISGSNTDIVKLSRMPHLGHRRFDRQGRTI